MISAFMVGLPSLIRTCCIADVFIYSSAALMFSAMLGWFVFSHMLYQKNMTKDLTGVKKIIKIGSYIIGSGQVLVLAISLLFGMVIIISGPGFNVIGFSMTFVGGLFMIFPLLLL